MFTIDKKTVDQAGAFLIGELERLDQTLNLPLVSYKWSRDMPLRSDVSIADEISSFTNTDFAAAGGVNPNGKNWIGKNSTAIAKTNLYIEKTAQPLTLWGMELGWTLPELASAQQLGRPIDTQMYDAMQMKWNMDIDEQVYIGDEGMGVTGLLNLSNVVPLAAAGAWTATTDPDIISQDINLVLTDAWLKSGYAVCPSKIGIAPELFGLLSNKKVSSAGNISLLEYVKINTIAFKPWRGRISPHCGLHPGREIRAIPARAVAEYSARVSRHPPADDLLRPPRPGRNAVQQHHLLSRRSGVITNLAGQPAFFLESIHETNCS